MGIMEYAPIWEYLKHIECICSMPPLNIEYEEHIVYWSMPPICKYMEYIETIWSRKSMESIAYAPILYGV